ncbi:MAG: CUAEP/CCAEP-tail radical SAM protein [candidate division KSB1 bacterium]|nr:CUAEP/CCAEP-tail radical SAM protein [candidate division KSB1 bacterium]
MTILLISTYELGHQPFNLASPAAYLLEAGYEVHCLDLAVQPLDESLVRNADVVAISTPMHTALRIGLKVARRVKSLNPEAHRVFYGLYAGLNARYLLDTIADAVIGGEYEHFLIQWLKALVSGRRDEVPGVVTQTGGQILYPRQRFLRPARHLLPPLDQYTRLSYRGELYRVGYVEASRGCAHKCKHCPITPAYSGRVRIVQREVVLADIEQLVDMGARHITFGDPDFLNGVRHSVAIVRELHRRWPELTFDFTAKIEHLLEYRELLPELRRLGCLFVVSAVECIQDRTLALLDKGHTRVDVEAALDIMQRAGIVLRPSLMPFTPWTGVQDFIELLDFVAENGLVPNIDPIQYCIRLLLPPESPLLDLPELAPYLCAFDEEKFSYEWHHPEPEADELQQRVWDTVERMLADGHANAAIFARIRDIASEYAHGEFREAPVVLEPDIPPPRLTEDWFC